MIDKARSCDKHIRINSEIFKKNTLDILNAHKDNNWNLANKLISKYIKNNDSTTILDNPYLNAISDCARRYLFSNEINYYHELSKVASLFLMNVNHSIRKNEPISDSTQEHYDFTIHYLDLILNAENKSANKSFKLDAK
ncbi:MAG: hypothetical protein OEY89_13160 [Gammaproteobacteria bacterium]|nr:hypothetical protein [Gammaproteobacteria bacterium]